MAHGRTTALAVELRRDEPVDDDQIPDATLEPQRYYFFIL